MSRKQLKPTERKTKFSITIHPSIFNVLETIKPNKSRYIERIIYEDLLKNNYIDKSFKYE